MKHEKKSKREEFVSVYVKCKMAPQKKKQRKMEGKRRRKESKEEEKGYLHWRSSVFLGFFLRKESNKSTEIEKDYGNSSQNK